MQGNEGNDFKGEHSTKCSSVTPPCNSSRNGTPSSTQSAEKSFGNWTDDNEELCDECRGRPKCMQVEGTITFDDVAPAAVSLKQWSNGQ